MNWQQDKARRERLEKVKQNSRYLHDLFFKKPPAPYRTEPSEHRSQSTRR